ncbi:MAG: hydroxymethylglutaryl-CoA lyase [Chitinophagaceae bacterium]|nr:MAG: hydroxymethylglutaryl-CoA lyase [Chitinophagaceae bacterium]
MSKEITIVECPRDAMQGWSEPIPTGMKVDYINQLGEVGFDTIDFGSFVSPKAIPQMADTKFVLRALDSSRIKSKLLAIVANQRGAEEAALFPEISYLGYPFSISETFQLRNANTTIAQSLEVLKNIVSITRQTNKKLVVYISMAFGNPYGDAYTLPIVYKWCEAINKLGVDIVSLADTVGVATPDQVFSITEHVIAHSPTQQFGVHLHSTPDNWQLKLQAALDGGCRRFDGALNGIGGCPMADDVLVGNMNTQHMIAYFESLGYTLNLDHKALQTAGEMALKIFAA